MLAATSPPATYFHTRTVFQRALAFIYFIAFLIAVNQYCALVGEHGITPLWLITKSVSPLELPSLLYLSPTDAFIHVLTWGGLGLSIFAMSGFSERLGHTISILTWGLMWVFYLSLVNMGQSFYSFGWDILLCETGFLAIFLGSRSVRPPAAVIWLIIWIAVRLMLGAGLIKIRADTCWWNCSCMDYHYETQPSPNPLSWLLHRSPHWFHQIEILFNHFVELVVPLFLLAPRPLRYIAAALTIAFQFLLIISGNLSWLNYIAIVVCLPCFDDRFLGRIFRQNPPSTPPLSDVRLVVLTLLCLVIGLLSFNPVMNMASEHQRMIETYDSLRLVNSYGAFGGVTEHRDEIIIEGTDSDNPGPGAVWREYNFKVKPGKLYEAPSIVSPYHYKLDWQMWFVPFRDYRRHDWFLPFVYKLLKNDRAVLDLMADNPFPNAPPKYIRARRYRYHFTNFGEPGWWKRQLVELYMPPFKAEDFTMPEPPP